MSYNVNVISKPSPLWPFNDTTAWNSSPPPQRSNHDLLAVSAQLYRKFRNDPSSRFGVNLIETSKFMMIIEDQDRQRASEIVDHFSEQIVLAQLQGDFISDFQRAVAEFINSDRLTLRHDQAGLVYRLPEYYESDLKTRNIIRTNFGDHECVRDDDRAIRKLCPIDTVERNTRQQSVIQYWFKDSHTGNPTVLPVDSKNQLKYLWDALFYAKKELVVSADFQKRTHSSGTNYIFGRAWKLEMTE
jgi:hypothetical protein